MPATEDEQPQDPDFVERLSSAQKLLETWKKGQKHLNTFWKLWFDEYVLSLRERMQKHLKAPRVQSKAPPTKGDVVLLKESSPRGTWKLGMIEELITSKDNEVRAATVRTASGKLLNRPLNFLYPLECSEVSENQPNRTKLLVTKNRMTQASRRVGMNLLRNALFAELRSKQEKN